MNLKLAMVTLASFNLSNCAAQAPELVIAPAPIAPPAQDAPADPAQGWSESSVAAHGFDEARITAMMEAVAADEFTGITSILIAHKGELVEERYFGGATQNQRQNMRSASKTVTAALVGITIDRGELNGVDEPVLAMFPEYQDEALANDPQRGSVTLAHLLSMSSGVKGNEDQMYPTDDWIKFYFDQPLAARPGERFSYATSGAVVLGNVITRASDLRIPDYANEHLLGPMGIRSYKWPITNSRDSQGLAMTGGGLQLRPRDIAKFGQLYLDKGMWKDRRILSEEWVTLSTTKHATSDLYGEDYGYFWRMLDRKAPGGTVRSWEAWGNGGQFIHVIPQLDLVVVFTGTNYGMMPEMEQPFILLEEYIVPTFTPIADSAGDTAADQ